MNPAEFGCVPRYLTFRQWVIRTTGKALGNHTGPWRHCLRRCYKIRLREHNAGRPHRFPWRPNERPWCR